MIEDNIEDSITVKAALNLRRVMHETLRIEHDQYIRLERAIDAFVDAKIYAAMKLLSDDLKGISK